MRPTRRYWAVAALAVLLAGLAVVFDRAALLAGTLGLGAWLLAAGVGFHATVTSLDDVIELDVGVDDELAVVDDELAVTLRAAPAATDATVTARLHLPPGLARSSAGTGRVRVRADHPTETTVAVRTRIAGRLTVPAPEVTVRDARGLFTETLTRGGTATVTVEPHRPTDLAVGAGEERYAAIEGRESPARRGEGIEPGELRQYVPGETAGRIDWNATARLAETYVRTFEADAALRTAIVLDARGATGVGPPGASAFAYLREVALGLLSLSRRHTDPVGLAVLDDDGLAVLRPPQAGGRTYDRLRRDLLALEAPRPAGDTGARPAREGAGSLARRLERHAGNDGTFVETLSSFLAARGPLPVDVAPLRAATRALVDVETARTVLLVTDAEPRMVSQAVEDAQAAGGRVAVFIAPTVLYATDSLADVEDAYERYRDFESFRRDLDRRADVDAFEVGPGDRIDELRAGAPAADAD